MGESRVVNWLRIVEWKELDTWDKIGLILVAIILVLTFIVF